MAGAEPGFVGDIDFEWMPGGETFFDMQLADEAKSFAARGASSIVIDTADNPAMPRGSAQLRLILVATFFVEPTEAKHAAGALK